MASSLCFKSCKDHNLHKSYNGGLWKKHLQVCALKKKIWPVALHTLATMHVTCNMFMMRYFEFIKSYNDFSFQKVHLLKTKTIQTAENEPY